MKLPDYSTKNSSFFLPFSISSFILLLCLLPCSCEKPEVTPVKDKITLIAKDLPGIMGVETDRIGNIWVSLSGTDIPDDQGDTHNDNGKVVVITPQGQVHDAIVHLSSYTNVHSGELQGTVHILLDGSILYILSGDYLYRADISRYKPGDAPIDAAKLPRENIVTKIESIPSVYNPDMDSHPYHLTKGPRGDLYIADAGANAILHRKGENYYVVFAEIPSLPNPFFPGMGGPDVQSVPTSIRFDGKNFFVTTLTGFPFPEGHASVYKITPAGQLSVYQKDFTMLTGQSEGRKGCDLFLQYTSSFDPATGFLPGSGSVIGTNGSSHRTIVKTLNQPVGIKKVNDFTWYVTSLGEGAIYKIQSSLDHITKSPVVLHHGASLDDEPTNTNPAQHFKIEKKRSDQ